MYKKGDFHIHTNSSDGKFTPREIIKMAKLENIDILSVTDHDTIDGLNEALKFGDSYKIKVVPGIELSTLYKNQKVHILGYFKNIDQIGVEFRKYLKEMSDFRIYRAKKIVENLRNIFKINLDFDKILEETKGVVARPHIASAIIKQGYNYNWNYIFKYLIGENSPAYVPNEKLELIDGINYLKLNHAVIVLAHPILIENLNLEELYQMPFDGIEAIYPVNSIKDTKRFKQAALKYKKIITAGSDFHGIVKQDSKHAQKIGKVFLSQDDIDIFLEKLDSKI
ncbi:PHP domain-containing protein [Clostridium fermenticellae]|uniref:PHP domain-containing protein n=1 Tax=Clostridium fermenticellae TaxID=2068654 RepID=A0A386H3H9_9CLOT|nr:PHP domain-containing protein [Clostridium fermenticellae]AYD40281.1 PHP domain-containing protein [Clostridium fermenticellae]